MGSTTWRHSARSLLSAIREAHVCGHGAERVVENVVSFFSDAASPPGAPVAFINSGIKDAVCALILTPAGLKFRNMHVASLIAYWSVAVDCDVLGRNMEVLRVAASFFSSSYPSDVSGAVVTRDRVHTMCIPLVEAARKWIERNEDVVWCALTLPGGHLLLRACIITHGITGACNVWETVHVAVVRGHLSHANAVHLYGALAVATIRDTVSPCPPSSLGGVLADIGELCSVQADKSGDLRHVMDVLGAIVAASEHHAGARGVEPGNTTAVSRHPSAGDGRRDG
jgi:hypothetical protein